MNPRAKAVVEGIAGRVGIDPADIKPMSGRRLARIPR